MKKFTLLSILIILLLSGFDQPEVNIQQEKDKYLVGAEKFKYTVDKKPKNVVIIDVRTPEEYTEGKIPGAINIDYKNENFKEEVGKLDKSKVYFIYCRSGHRSGNSRVIMNEAGIKNVYDLDGGILGWKELKYPVEQ